MKRKRDITMFLPQQDKLLMSCSETSNKTEDSGEVKINDPKDIDGSKERKKMLSSSASIKKQYSKRGKQDIANAKHFEY